MSANTDNPTVSFKLDDSEKTRLEKLRSRLKLHHWEKIERTYFLTADEEVAKKIGELKISDPAKYDEKYSDWTNRFSDFDMEWVKIRNTTTNIIEAHLMAKGRLRMDHLGGLSKGCQVSIMSGKLKDDPLPTTKVAALRINHVQMDIKFAKAKLIHNPEHQCNKSDTFKVGRDNLLYGKDAVKNNLHDFKAMQEKKNGKVTEDLIRSFMQTVINVSQDQGGRKDGDQPLEEDLEHDNIGDDHNFETANSRSNHSTLGASYLQGSSAGYYDHRHRPPFNRSQEMKDTAALTTKMTTGDPPAAFGSKQGLPGVPVHAGQHHHGVTEDEADDWNKLAHAPEEAVDQNVQVR